MTWHAALVTGSEQGLGEAIADLLTERCGEGRVANIEGALLRRFRSYEVAIAVQKRMDTIGPFDVVVNNFAINHLSWIGSTPAADEDIMRVNVMVPYWIVNALVAAKHPPCRVLNIASQTYRVPQRCTALYAASKAALVQMTRVMARELAPLGWVINVLAPGKILHTDMTRKTDAQVLALRGWDANESDSYARKLIPMGRFTNRTEVAKIALKVLEMEPYVNGAVIDAMGGV